VTRPRRLRTRFEFVSVAEFPTWQPGVIKLITDRFGGGVLRWIQEGLKVRAPRVPTFFSPPAQLDSATHIAEFL